jgi:hypothetical protein
MPVQINGKSFSEAEIQRMADAGLLGTKNDTTQTTFAQQPHGFSQQWYPQGGLFTRPGVDPRVISAVPALMGGMLARLYAGVSEIIQPEYDIITGVDDASGSNPSDYCGTPPTAGWVKVGTHRASFGKFFMGSEKITLNESGGMVNRADVNREFINNVAQQSPLLPDVLRAPDLNTFVGLFIYRFGINALRQMNRVLFSGSVANTGGNAETGFIKEFDGFDALIKTNYTDLETGNPMPAADSIIEDFASADATVSSNGIVELMANVLYRLRALASDTGMEPVTIELAMRKDMFHALTAVWPCSYLTDGCAVTSNDGERVNINAETQIQMRDDMRRGQYLWLNGEQIRVNLEDGIEQTTSGPGFSSTIYFIPVTAAGERITYVEGFNQANSQVQEFVNLSDARYRTSNGGFWAATTNQTAFCYELLFAAQPRLIMRAPFLAARIENVVYKLDNGYSRSSYPTEPYYEGGGRYLSAPYSGA